MRLYRGTKRVLSCLIYRYKLGLITNTNWAPLSRRVLAAHGLENYFDVTVFSSDFGYAKPHPSIFLHALERLNVNAGRCLHVGYDPLEDVRGALNVGMRCAYLKRRRRQIPGYLPSEVTDIPPQAIVLRTLPELLDYIAK